MPLQKLMIKRINALCGHQKFTSELRKYSKLTKPRNRIRYLLIINGINELFIFENVDVEFNTIAHYTTVINAIELLKYDDFVFKSDVIKLMVQMMEYNLRYIKHIKKLA